MPSFTSKVSKLFDLKHRLEFKLNFLENIILVVQNKLKISLITKIRFGIIIDVNLTNLQHA